MRSGLFRYEFLTSQYSQEARKSCTKRLRHIFRSLAAWNDSMTVVAFLKHLYWPKPSEYSALFIVYCKTFVPSSGLIYYSFSVIIYYCALGRYMFHLGHQGTKSLVVTSCNNSTGNILQFRHLLSCISILTGKFTK